MVWHEYLTDRRRDMADSYAIEKMVEKIGALRKSAAELKALSGGIEAVDRNVDRLLSSVRMLEINVSDVAGIVEKK